MTVIKRTIKVTQSSLVTERYMTQSSHVRELYMTQSAAITFPKADSKTSKEAVGPHSVVVPDRDLHAALV